MRHDPCCGRAVGGTRRMVTSANRRIDVAATSSTLRAAREPSSSWTTLETLEPLAGFVDAALLVRLFSVATFLLGSLSG